MSDFGSRESSKSAISTSPLPASPMPAGRGLFYALPETLDQRRVGGGHATPAIGRTRRLGTFGEFLFQPLIVCLDRAQVGLEPDLLLVQREHRRRELVDLGAGGIPLPNRATQDTGPYAVDLCTAMEVRSEE